MPKYNLSELVDPSYRTRSRKAGLRVPDIRLADDNSYRIQLQSLVKDARSYTNDYIIPAVNDARASFGDKALTEDALSDRVTALLTSLKGRLSSTASRVVSWLNSFLERVGTRAVSGFIANAKSILGVDLNSFVRYSDISDIISASAQAGSSLITNLSDDIVNRISQAILNNLANGGTEKDLAAALTQQFGFSNNRAKLIAYDQMGKLNGSINRTLQTNAGVDQYIWNTMRDERVRPTHRVLDGRTCTWADKSTSNGIYPGEEIRCRCWAVAVINGEAGRSFVATN